MSANLEIQRRSNFKAMLQSYRGEIEKALPRVGLTAERMLRMVATAATTNPKLLECSQASIIRSVLQAAQLGLEPDGVLGKAYLVPYKDQCQFQLGYQGMLELARRSKDIKRVRVETVREGDQFHFRKGIVEELVHVPQDNDLAPAKGYYAIVEMISGGIQWDYWSIARVEAHRQRYSKVKSKEGPWATSYDAMGMKTVLRHVLRLCPRTTELEAAERIETEDGSSSETALPISVSDLSTNETNASLKSSDSQAPGDSAKDDSPLPTSSPEEEELFRTKKAAALGALAKVGQPKATSSYKSDERVAIERDFWEKWNAYPTKQRTMAMDKVGVKDVTADLSGLSDDQLMALLNEGYVHS